MQPIVTIARCTDYAQAESALARVLEPLGGMAAFVRSGQTVLIKPNLLSDHAPGEAVTTHPEVVRAVIRAVRAAGGQPSVADSPANVMDLERVWRKTGIGAVCQGEGVPLINLEKAGSERIDVDGFALTIARPVLDAAVVISVAKAKTHVLTRFTGGVKNCYGTIPGFQKTRLHKLYMRPEAFGPMLLAVYRRVRPALTIMDAVVGMDGNGPSGGQPVALGFLAAAGDAVALDVVVCGRFGIKVAQVPYLREAARRGEGETVVERIRVLGDAAVLTEGPICRLPATVPMENVPGWLLALFGRLLWHRPAFAESCVFCGQCVKACPADALSLHPGSRPVVDATRCIECCCCHEVCPERAIEMRPGLAIRAYRALRGRRG
jgi:uncharacterized protein (DUF362 family)/Pyruvate/2-oxoacid:ferredoxin oxidoreductase delta subunit